VKLFKSVILNNGIGKINYLIVFQKINPINKSQKSKKYFFNSFLLCSFAPK